MKTFAQILIDRVDDLRGAGTKRSMALESIAKLAGLSKKTLEKWRNGDTIEPTRYNAIAVIKASGSLSSEEAEREYECLLADYESDAGTIKTKFEREPLNARKPSNHQLTLSNPPADRRASHYASRSTRVRGRDDQQKRLLSFLESVGDFRWLQIAGEGGQGKSRLALELWRKSSTSWHCGLLESSDVAAFNNRWAEWQPHLPTLMIADYVVGRESELRPIIQQLAKRTDLRQPVRLLLLERKPWDQSSIQDAVGDRAEWFVALNERHDGADAAIAETRFQDESGTNGVIELLRLSPEDLARVAVEVAQRPLLNQDHIKRQLAEIDREGRPLYACFLGEVLKDNPNLGLISIEKLLDEVLEKNRARRWHSTFGNSTPWIGEDVPAMRLAVLATMTDGIEFSEHGAQTNTFDAKPACWREACAVTDGILPPAGPPKSIPALQPDILGEWFVLRSVEKGLPLEPVVMAAWNAAPEKMAAFLQRLSRDFARSPKTSAFFEVEAQTDIAHRALSNVSEAAMGNFFRAHQIPPKSLVNALHQAATAGDAKAMNAWGYCLKHGFGVDQDECDSAYWYLKGAEAGNPAAMHGTGLCYLRGIGVEKNPAEAVNWFRKGAEAGGPRSMNSLGHCYKSGLGVEKNPAEAVNWFRKGAKVGFGGAMSSLGFCYETGFGVEKDLAEAMDWYRKGAEAGNGFAMIDLGRCYGAGIGVEKNPAEAVNWFRKGAEAGHPDAMTYLGHCYETGFGVEKDLAEAMDWYRKG
ncbi:hypothetical protein GS644_16030, partial [Ruegeria sp. HKCCD4318-2]|nr:hypothetical protein [Ruegeria sp. HKCCD4318-2]